MSLNAVPARTVSKLRLSAPTRISSFLIQWSCQLHVVVINVMVSSDLVRRQQLSFATRQESNGREACDVSEGHSFMQSRSARRSRTSTWPEVGRLWKLYGAGAAPGTAGGGGVGGALHGEQERKRQDEQRRAQEGQRALQKADRERVGALLHHRLSLFSLPLIIIQKLQ